MYLAVQLIDYKEGAIRESAAEKKTWKERYFEYLSFK